MLYLLNPWGIVQVLSGWSRQIHSSRFQTIQRISIIVYHWLPPSAHAVPYLDGRGTAALSSPLPTVSLDTQKIISNFYEVHFIFPLVVYDFAVISKKPFPNPRS
jgi:hypothetical protein